MIKKYCFYFCLSVFFIACGDILCSEETSDKKSGSLYVLCHQLSGKFMSRVKVSQKNTDNGIIIVMTGGDPGIVRELQRRISLCRSKIKTAAASGQKELMSMEEIDTEITHLNNGVLIVLSSADTEVVKKIQNSVFSFSTTSKQKD